MTYLDETQLDAATELDERIELRGSRRGEVIEIFARFVVDAAPDRTGFFIAHLDSLVSYQVFRIHSRSTVIFPE